MDGDNPNRNHNGASNCCRWGVFMLVKWIKKKLLERRWKKLFISTFNAIDKRTNAPPEKIIAAICEYLNEIDESGVWTFTWKDKKNVDCSWKQIEKT